jgi:hypothetical protein
MKKLIAACIAMVALSGCVVATPEYQVAYESDVVVGGYYIGYYNPGFGYWTGWGWDPYFYYVGHPGYGHFYRGCPSRYYRGFHGGGFHGRVMAPRGGLNIGRH